MRVLLICPSPTIESPPGRPRHAPHYSAIVAAALQRAGHDVAVLDAHLEQLSVRVTAERARRHGPDAVLVTHSDYNRDSHEPVLQAVVLAVQTALPGVPLAGFARLDAGPARKAMARIPALSLLLFDEPEVPAVAWLERLAESRSLADLPGSIQRRPDGEGADVVETAPEAVDLDQSPVPAWDLVDVQRYGFSPHQSAEEIVYPVLASRGCPYPCFYCEVRNRPTWRPRSVDVVLSELNELHQRFGTRSVFLADPTFALNREWTLEFCRRLKAEGPPGLRWSCMSRTDRVDPELLQAMADAGCWNILFGIESLEAGALKASKKQLDPTTVRPAIEAAQNAGMEVIASIMIGLPGDSPAGFERSLRALTEMEPDFAQFFVVQISEDEAPEGGRLVSDWDGSRYDFWGHVYASDAFDGHDQLLALRSAAYRRFYLRPRYARLRLQRMRRGGRLRAELQRAARGGLLAAKLALGREPAG